jgi:YgiT-type zinc finger domain-containing protein
MTCWRCGSRMSEQRITFGACEGFPPLVIRNVPATVCGQCGEQAFSDQVVDVLERIRDGNAPAPQLSYLYTYDYDEAVAQPKGMIGTAISTPSLYLRGSTVYGQTVSAGVVTTDGSIASGT